VSAALKVIARGYGDGALIFEDRVEVTTDEIPEVVGRLAEKHILALTEYELHMIEFEFPDAPEDERFLRFGSDAACMVLPIGVRL